MKRTIISAACITLLTVCAAPAMAQQSAAAKSSSVQMSALVSGIELNSINPAVRIQDDFYGYVNGGWDKKTAIPADRPSWSSFDELRIAALDNLRVIIDDTVKSPGPAGSESRKIADMYSSFMDDKQRDALGFSPLKNELASIAALTDKKQLPAMFAAFNRIGVDTPFTLLIWGDAKDSNQSAMYLNQSGLGMPDRDYYLKDDDQKLKAIRTKYQAHIEAMLAMSGDRNAAAGAQAILALETSLAKVQWTRAEARNPIKSYNRVELDKLAALTPGFDWQAWMAAAGVAGKGDFVVVRQPSYFTGMAEVLAATPLETWKSYLRWQLVSSYAQYLGKAAVAERFGFTGTTLRDVPQNEAPWKLGVRTTDAVLGEMAGKLYVARYFPPEDKARMLTLVNNLLASFREGIDKLDWMGPATKQEAQTKLASFKPYIGYPDKWRDYSALAISKDDLTGNIRRSREFTYQRDIDKLGKPVDKEEWGMTPQTVNATFSPLRNAITFPAGILQPPFFNSKADDAVNYGAIGAVIGHEIGHGFDDNGSQYDGFGNLRNWWTKEDRANFTSRAAGLVRQYSAYSPVPGYFVNGEVSLGENIGDNSGLAIAYQAYQKSLAGKASPVIDGYTGEQRFFLGYGQIWRGKFREAALISQLKAGTHTPTHLRGPGAVINQPGFHSAFDTKPGDKMYLTPEQRVIIW